MNLFSLVLVLVQMPMGSRTVLVRAGEAASIQAIVAAARDGDTVRLMPGRYPGPVVIEHRILLLGVPGAIIAGGHQGTVITVRADSVILQGLELEGSGRALESDDAVIKLEHCTGCRVSGTTIRDPLHGIYLLASRGVLLRDNHITGAADLVESARGNGIHLWNSTGNRIEGNRIVGTRDGIYFSFATHNTVRDNDVSGVRYGLHYMYSDDNQFEHNRFRHNAAGAAIMFSKRILLRDNEFSCHVGYRAYGLLLQTTEQVLVERNRIEGNLTGMFMDGSTGDTIRDNVISGNGVGIDMLASSEGNTFSGNTITDNRIAVRLTLGAGENRWDDGVRGNYWDAPAVFDLDGDGLGDRPYRVGDTYTALAATRPALELFSGTFAARALAWAEEAFPVFNVPRVEDRRPLVRRPAMNHSPHPVADAP